MTIYNSIDTRIVSSLQEISICKDNLHKYLSLINTYIENPPKENYEKHHILPKSLFPEYKSLCKNKWNEVKLPYAQHLEAHYYLALFTDNIKMISAYHLMCRNLKYEKSADINHIKLIKAKVKEFNTNKAHAFDVNGNYLGLFSSFDERWSTGEFNGNTKNLALAVDKDYKFIGKIHKDDPRWENGEILHISKNSAGAKDINGNKLGRVRTDDPRWENGEICGMNKGLKTNKGNAKCSKTGKSIGWIDLSDPRWKSGEIVGINAGNNINKGNAKCPVTGQYLGWIDLSDPRWKSGEIVGFSTNKIVAKIVKTNENIYVDKDDHRLITKEIVPVMTNRALAKCAITNKILGNISKDDPRWKSKEIIGVNAGKIKLYNLKTKKAKYFNPNDDIPIEYVSWEIMKKK